VTRRSVCHHVGTGVGVGVGVGVGFWAMSAVGVKISARTMARKR